MIRLSMQSSTAKPTSEIDEASTGVGLETFTTCANTGHGEKLVNYSSIPMAKQC